MDKKIPAVMVVLNFVLVQILQGHQSASRPSELESFLLCSLRLRRRYKLKILCLLGGRSDRFQWDLRR